MFSSLKCVNNSPDARPNRWMPHPPVALVLHLKWVTLDVPTKEEGNKITYPSNENCSHHLHRFGPGRVTQTGPPKQLVWMG